MDISILNQKQLDKAERIFVKTKKIRVKVTMYKKGDPSLAQFRLQAMGIFQDAVCLKVLNRSWTKKITNFISNWNDGSDLGNNIQKLFSQIKNYKDKK